MKSNPIILIDDDQDDIEIFIQTCKELSVNNEIIEFQDGHSFIKFMKETDQKPFFILCDINLGGTSGLEIKKVIFNDQAVV